MKRLPSLTELASEALAEISSRDLSWEAVGAGKQVTFEGRGLGGQVADEGRILSSSDEIASGEDLLLLENAGDVEEGGAFGDGELSIVDVTAGNLGKDGVESGFLAEAILACLKTAAGVQGAPEPNLKGAAQKAIGRKDLTDAQGRGATRDIDEAIAGVCRDGLAVNAIEEDERQEKDSEQEDQLFHAGPRDCR